MACDERVERLHVAGQRLVGDTQRDLVLQGDDVVDDGAVVGDTTSPVPYAVLNRLCRLVDVVRRQGVVHRARGLRDGRRDSRRSTTCWISVLTGPRSLFVLACSCASAAPLLRDQGDERRVPLVLQVVHDGDELRAELGQLLRPAELARAALRVRHPQAAEDQPHQQGRHDDGEQPAGHRPVGQAQVHAARVAPGAHVVLSGRPAAARKRARSRARSTMGSH